MREADEAISERFSDPAPMKARSGEEPQCGVTRALPGDWYPSLQLATMAPGYDRCMAN